MSEQQEKYTVGSIQFEKGYLMDNIISGLISNNQSKLPKIYFSKVKPTAKIPSKREEDAGLDIYACFDESEIVIQPNGIKLIPTGIASACSSDYVLILKERGSSGTKGMAVRCGVVDSGYRNEIFVPINNTSTKTIVITRDVNKSYKKLEQEEKEFWGKDYHDFYMEDNYVFYPSDKAIAQILIIPVPKVQIEELPYNELLEIKSERGLGQLGSTNK